MKIYLLDNNVFIVYNLSYWKIMSWSMNVNISELKIFEIFSLHLTDKIHFWQDVCLKDCDHLHQFNLRYYKPNVLPCVGAPPYRYNIMISLTRCTFSRICIFGNVYYSSLKIWISVQYINIKSSRMFLNVNKTKTKQHNLKKNVTQNLKEHWYYD